MTVPIVGILGGIGSGKSSVVRHISDFQLHIIDADRIGHALLDEFSVQEELRNAFNESVFAPSGGVDRSRLAAVVFGNSSEHKAALTRLEQILHPAIHREIEQQIKTAPKETDAVVIDAALLLEAGWAAECDCLIFIDTPDDIRMKRVEANRGWTADELRQREAAQISVEEKRRRADYVVDNSGTIQESVRQMSSIFGTVIG